MQSLGFTIAHLSNFLEIDERRPVRAEHSVQLQKVERLLQPVGVPALPRQFLPAPEKPRMGAMPDPEVRLPRGRGTGTHPLPPRTRPGVPVNSYAHPLPRLTDLMP